MIQKVLNLFVMFICIYSLAFSQEKGFSKISDDGIFIKKLIETASKTKTIESDFTQEKYLSFLSEKVISKGSFHFKHPNKLRWEYKKPFQYLIVINTNTMKIKYDGNENKFDTETSKMFKEINDILIGCVTGNLLSDERKFKSTHFENEMYYLTKLQPLSETVSGFIKTINIYFDKNDMTVAKIKMLEPSGDYTIILFESKKINKNINDEVFNIN